MFVSDCYNVNEKGHLTISGCDTVELAEKYGTALYVMSEDEIRSVCRRYKSSFERHYNGNGTALYASKAFCCKEICRIVTEEGLDLDVVSGGELYIGSQMYGNSLPAGSWGKLFFLRSVR